MSLEAVLLIAGAFAVGLVIADLVWRREMRRERRWRRPCPDCYGWGTEAEVHDVERGPWPCARCSGLGTVLEP